MRAFSRFVLLLFIVLAFSGCARSGDAPGSPSGAQGPSRTSVDSFGAYAVVAVIDTGINPYHVDFRDPTRATPPGARIPGYPSDATPINLTLDAKDYNAAFAKDGPEWAKVTTDKLVWFPGTKIVGGIAVGAAAGRTPVLDEQSHGSGTASVVLQSCPECSLVTVDYVSARSPEALEWVAAQPWIDAVSMSWGLLGARLDRPDLEARLHAALYKVWKSGKLLFAAAGNTPYPYFHYLPAGSPYVIGVGGVEFSTKGETAIASKFPDMVSNYTQRVAHHFTLTSTGPGQGTSFAAPAVAGLAASLLYDARAYAGVMGVVDGGLVRGNARPGILADGLVTNAEVWNVLNQSAVYFNTTWYRPHEYHVQNPLWLVVGATLPILPAPHVQMGWGYHGRETRYAAWSTAMGFPLPEPRKADARPFMQAKDRLEHDYWD